MPLRGRWPALLLAGAICLAGAGLNAGAAWAQGQGDAVILVSTDLDGALDLARRALSAGRPDLAEKIARQILARKPDDPAGHMVLAAALTRQGKAAAAVPVARRGFRLAEGKEARFEGAYLAAEALAAAGRPWLSKLWLRRADLYAPSKQHEAVLARAYAGLSAQSRVSFGLSLFGGPSENVNGGSLHDTFWFYGIPIPITEALPGQVWGASAQIGYRLTDRMQARLVWSHAEVVLGDRARAIDPLAEASDYRQDQLSLGLAHAWQDQTGLWAVLSEASVGRKWKGGAISADLMRGTVELRRALGADWTVSGKLDIEKVEIPAQPVADSVTTRVSLGASHRADWLGAVTVELGAVDVASDAAGVAWQGPSLTLGWRPPIRSEAFGLVFDLAAEQRDYWRTPSFDPDTWVNLSATAELSGLEIMGINPTVTFSAARTKSDVVVRDMEEIGITFGLASRF